jgi:hypothetical protein
MAWNTRLSMESPRLSPMTKTCPSGTVWGSRPVVSAPSAR